MRVPQEPQRWAEAPLTGAQGTESRRVARGKKSAAAMAGHPGRRLPTRCRRPEAGPAPSTLWTPAAAPPAQRQAGQRAVGRAARRQPGVALVWDDTPARSWAQTPP